MDNPKTGLISERSKNSSYLFEAVKNLKNNVRDNFAFQTNNPTIDNSSSTYHNHRIQSIKSNRHLSSTVERYSSVSAQLKSTFNQVCQRQLSISSTSSIESSSSTSSSLPSSIVEIIVKSNDNLFKSAENLLKSKENSLINSDEKLFDTADNLLKSDEIIQIKSKNQSILSTHENLFKCLSITDESLELNNLDLFSSNSSLDSSSFENIYSLYPIDKRSNSINKSKTSQELGCEEDNEKTNTKRGRSLSYKECLDEVSSNRNYLVKETYSKEKECLNCRINLIELNLKDRKSLTISIKWPLKKIKDNKLFSIQLKPTSDNQLLNVYIKY